MTLYLISDEHDVSSRHQGLWQRSSLHGRSLIPLMNGTMQEARECAYIGHHDRQWTVRTHEWSYHLPIDRSKPPELFNLRRDLGEHENLADDDTDLAKELELNLRTFVDDITSDRSMVGNNPSK